jgi:hypothetical protein
MTKKRQLTERYIINAISRIDKDNAKRYETFFKSLSDAQFDNFMKALKSNQIQLRIYFPNVKKNIKNQTIFDLAKYFKIPLYDYIRLKNRISNTYYYSKHPLLILKLPVRRVKQFLFNKIRIPESDKHISKLSGQVMKPDKGSKISLIETYLLASKGLEKSIVELIKVRGGDLKNYHQLKSKILETGEVSLQDLELDKSKPKSVTVLDGYLKAIHLNINLNSHKSGV